MRMNNPTYLAQLLIIFLFHPLLTEAYSFKEHPNNFIQSAVADAGPDQSLTCVDFEVTLGGENTSVGPEFSYEWKDANENIIGTSPEVTVYQSGEYILKVTNTTTSFVAMDTTNVTEDFGVPTINGINVTPSFLNCTNPIAQLEAVLADPSINVSYEWSTFGGNILSSTTSNTIEVNTNGSYELVVTNEDNGCSSQENTIVPADFQSSTTNINFGTFSTFPIEIDPSQYMTNSTAAYSWQAQSGLQVNNFPIASISGPGQYTFIEDLGSPSCINEYVYEVYASSLTADAGPSQEINCANPSVTLGSSSNPTGSEFVYEWTDITGAVIGTTPFIEVSNPGEFQLTITNSNTGETDSDLVTIVTNLIIPQISISTPSVLSCSEPSTTLTGTTFFGSNFTYVWTNSANDVIANTADVTVNEADTYTLTVTNNENACSNSASVTVEADQNEETINVPSITTTNASSTLDATEYLDTQQGPWIFEWYNENNILLATTPDLTVNQTGIYTCFAENANNGCTTTIIYTLNFSTTLTADAGADQVLTCTSFAVTLGSMNSSQGPAISYVWTDEFGTVISNDLQVEVTEPSQYQLEITDTNTGETAIDVVLVTTDFEAPIFSISPNSAILTCNNSSVTLTATSSNVPTGAESYFWSGPGVDSDPNQSSITVSQAGAYILSLTNTINGCSAEEVIEVLTDQESSTINVPTITSSDPVYTIDPSNFIDNSNFTYQWITQNGLTVTNFPLAEVSLAGTYIFVGTNTQTGCTTEYIYTIQFSTITIADAGIDQVLNCAMPTAILGGVATSLGANYIYTWTDIQGNLIANTPTVEVSDAGTYNLTVLNVNTNETDSDEVIIDSDFEVPDVTIIPPLVLDCATTSITLTGSTSIINATYEWSNSFNTVIANTPDPIINEAGTYTLIIENVDNGCTSSASVTVEENIDGGNFDITPIQANQFPVTLTADEFPSGLNLIFEWIAAPGLITSGAFTAEVSQAGQYDFVATNVETGCAYTYTYTVYNSVLADAGSSSTLTCNIVEVTLDGTASSTGTEFSYLWTGPNGIVGTNITEEVVQSGLYTLEVTNSTTGETFSDQVMINEDFAIPVFDIANPMPLSFEQPLAVLDATLYSPAINDATFNWIGPSGQAIANSNSEDIEVDIPGTYTLTVTNNLNGCTNTESVELAQEFNSETIELQSLVTTDFPIEIDPRDLIDGIDGLTYQPFDPSRSSEFEYKWIEREGLTLLDFPVAQISKVGIYAFLQRDTASGFVTRYEYDIMSNTDAPIVDAGADQVLNCAIMSVELLGSNLSTGADFSYAWTDQNGNVISTNQAVQISDAGTYTFTVTNNETGEQASDNVEVIEDTAIPVINIVTPELLDCNTMEVQIDMSTNVQSNAVQIQWSGPSIITNPNLEDITVNQAGFYTVEVTNTQNACSSSMEIAIDEVEPIEIDFMVNLNNQLEVNVTGGVGAYTYDWNVNEATNIIENPEDGFEYVLTVTDENGCTQTASYVYLSNSILTPIAQKIICSPNPTQGQLMIQMSETQVRHLSALRLYNVQGIEVPIKHSNRTNRGIELNLDAIPSGTYLLHLVIEDEIFYQKIIVN